MPRASKFHLDADDIVAAAIAIVREQGLDALSMRTLAHRLGVSPVPLYNRIGNKDALVDKLAETLLADLAPPAAEGELWVAYAARWASELRRRLRATPDTRLILQSRRWAYVDATRPLVDRMRAGGVRADDAVRACRLLMWATIGFVAVEAGGVEAGRVRPVGVEASGVATGDSDARERVAGGDATGVTEPEADALFTTQIAYLLAGLQGEARDS
jgi:TetR/AcrR family tetracycline transcriptional repressor